MLPTVVTGERSKCQLKRGKGCAVITRMLRLLGACSVSEVEDDGGHIVVLVNGLGEIVNG